MVFILYTIIAWLANASLIKIVHVSIQPGQWLDSLLHWQQRLQKWDMEGKTFLAKAGGYCELCFSHLLTFAGYWIYAAFMYGALDVRISNGLHNIIGIILVNILWYFVYVGIGTNLALYFITRLFEK